MQIWREFYMNFAVFTNLKFTPRIGHFLSFCLTIDFKKCPKLDTFTTFQNIACLFCIERVSDSSNGTKIQIRPSFEMIFAMF